jgi:hypothetical protein
MNKKAIAILGAIFLLIVVVLGFLVYQKYTNKPATPVPVATTTPITQQNPASTTPTSAGPGSLVQLTTTPVVSPTLFYNGNGITYFTPSGDLYQADLVSASGTALQVTRQRNLSITTKPGISKILWPPAGNNFMAQVSQPAPSSSPWSYFNSQTGVYTDLPSQIESFDWMPSGNQIVYVWLDSGKASLNISDPDTKNWKKIADMWENDDKISISPDGTNILYYEQNNASSTNPIYLTTPDGKIWKTLVSTGYNLGVLWSPDGQKFLFGKKDPSSGSFQLWEYNLLTGASASLNVSTTPDKAVWGSDSATVYAAVTAGTSGSFVKINTATLTPKIYNNFQQQINAQNLFLSQDGTKLFFWNTNDGNLYYLDISQ